MLSLRSVLCFALIVGVAMCQPAEDRVPSLPGWKQALPSAQYSGYLDVDNGKHLHYWMVESEGDPAKDPLVLWFNGGPGCSSVEGYLYEQGTFRVVEPWPQDPKEVPELELNPTRWNRIATVVFIEAPACVGFSYADDPVSGCVTDDAQTAEDNYQALLGLYEKFPSLKKNELFISGESYAGVYVPTLAMQVIKHGLPLAGILVGNGVIGNPIDTHQHPPATQLRYLYNRGMASEIEYQAVQDNCKWGNKDGKGDIASCLAAVSELKKNVGNINVYNTLGDCVFTGPQPGKNQGRVPMTQFEQMLSAAEPNGPLSCFDVGAAAAWLDTKEVREALHVQPLEEMNPFMFCTSNLTYHTTVGSLIPDYKDTIIPATRVLIYSGDADASVPYLDSMRWTSEVGQPLKESWRPWSLNDQVAGYVTTYTDDFYFLTIRGAGHMVPQTRPEQCFAMFQRFLANERF